MIELRYGANPHQKTKAITFPYNPHLGGCAAKKQIPISKRPGLAIILEGEKLDTEKFRE